MKEAVAVLDILAAFFAAALAALGVGGGGLLVIYLVLVLSMEQHMAQGLNLLFFIVASLFSLPFHIGKKRVKLKLTLLFSTLGLIGAYFGCLLSARVSPGTARFFFGIMLALTGGITLYKTVREYFLKSEKKNKAG